MSLPAGDTFSIQSFEAIYLVDNISTVPVSSFKFIASMRSWARYVCVWYSDEGVVVSAEIKGESLEYTCILQLMFPRIVSSWAKEGMFFLRLSAPSIKTKNNKKRGQHWVSTMFFIMVTPYIWAVVCMFRLWVVLLSIATIRVLVFQIVFASCLHRCREPMCVQPAPDISVETPRCVFDDVFAIIHFLCFRLACSESTFWLICPVPWSLHFLCSSIAAFRGSCVLIIRSAVSAGRQQFSYLVVQEPRH